MANKKPSDVIDLGKLIRKVWSRKKLFFILWPATAILAYLLIICVPRYYSTSVKLAPEMSNTGTGGALSSLASSFGIDFGDIQTTDAISPFLYPDLMGDNAFVTKLWEMPVKNLDGDINTTYYDYLKNYQKSTWWSKAISWTIRKLKPKKKEMNIKSGDGQFNPYYLSEKDDRLANGVRGLIFISVDKKTGVIGINVTDQDPIICKTMADSTTSLLQQAIIDYRTNKARVDVEYYTKLEAEALKSYEEARMKYIRYADSNIDPVLESYRAKRNDLENDMQLKYNKYTTLNTQLDGARAKVQERTPAFTLLKGASVPVKPAGPKRMLFVLGMLIMVTFGGIVYIIKDDIKEALFQSE